MVKRFFLFIYNKQFEHSFSEQRENNIVRYVFTFKLCSGYLIILYSIKINILMVNLCT